MRKYGELTQAIRSLASPNYSEHSIQIGLPIREIGLLKGYVTNTGICRAIR